VLGAIRELEWVPSPMARGLISNRTHSLGMVSAEISDHSFAQAVAGAEAEARKRGYYLMVASVEDESRDDERGYLRLMLARRVEGLIVARPSVPLSSEQLLPAVAAGIPLVAIGSSELPGFTVVDVDNVDGGRQATAFLIAQGHRRIATITGPREWNAAVARLDGFHHALTTAGMTTSSAPVQHAQSWGPDDGRVAMEKLLASGAKFSAIFAHSDMLAIGAMTAINARGLRIPEDVSIIGYDDIPVASFLNPPLTTMRQPIRDVGALAARLLIDAIARKRAGERVEANRHLLTPQLVVRESVSSRS